MQESSQNNEIFVSLSEAATYTHVGRQAIFQAIKKGRLKAEKQLVETKKGTMVYRWLIRRDDLDHYQDIRYNHDERQHKGEKVWDLDSNRWSVLQACKNLSLRLGRPFAVHRLYYLIRQGEVRASKKGYAWIVTEEEIEKVYQKEIRKDPTQLEMM